MLQLQERIIALPSDPLRIVEAENLVEEIRQELGLSEEQNGNVLLCVTEAVRNAMQHGNRMDPSKAVRIHVQQLDDILLISVQDEGSGFDFEHLPDPTAPENLEKLTGRGVFLIRQLADETGFENNGSGIVMKFHLSAPAA